MAWAFVWGVPAAAEAAVEALAAPSLPWHVPVPDFLGMAMTDVWAAALHAHVKVRLHRLPDESPVIVGHEPPSDGCAVRQVPEPGAKVHRDAEIELFVQFPPA